MATIKLATEQDLLKFENDILLVDLIKKQVPINDIRLVDYTMIEVEGKSIKIDSKVINDFAKIFNLNKSFIETFDKNVKASAISFINKLRDLFRSSNISVTLHINPYTKKVLHITKSNERGSISNKNAYKVAGQIIDKFGLDIKDVSVNMNSGNFAINLITDNEFQVDGLPNEVFKSGLTISNSLRTGLQVSTYTNRMFCANGMRTALARDTFSINNLNVDNLENLHYYIAHLRKNNYVSDVLIDKIKTANNTRASLAEMQTAHNIISTYDEDYANVVVPLRENEEAYKKLLFTEEDLFGGRTLSHKELKAAATNQSVWSCLNAVTYFGSHSDKLKDSDRQKVFVDAGRVLGKGTFDCEVVIPDAFDKDILTQTRQIGSMLN